MPKSKVRKKSDYTVNSNLRTPVKVKIESHSSKFYVGVMLGLMLLGLLWLIVFYLFVTSSSSLSAPGGYLHWMEQLSNWNFLIGIGIIVVALLMSLRWK